MPGTTTKIKPQSIKSYSLTLGSSEAPWKLGVISYVNQARLPAGAVTQAINCMQTQDGVWSNRWGSMNYGVALTGPVTGAGEFVVYNSDGTTTQYIGVIDNGSFKYSKDGGTWTTVTGHTFTTTAWTTLLQYNTKILFANGVDNFCYYDIKTTSIVTFTALSAPGMLTYTATPTSLTTGTTPYQLYYMVTAVSQTGETIPSAVLQIAVSNDRGNWFNPNNGTITPGTSTSIALTIPRVTGAIGYNIYASDGVSGVGYYLDSVPDPGGAGTTVTFTDYGNQQLNDLQQVPTSDTTAAPKFSNLAVSDNRLWATGDPNNPQRVYYAAATPAYAEAFNPYVGGGYFDIQPGTNQRPRVVHQFRSGKGDPMTTILMAEPSGYGSTWNVQIGTNTIGNTVITVPSLIQSLGTFGSLSPLAVVETNQNVYFHSGVGGFFSTGSVPTLFNVLATQETSIMVRPDIQNLNLAALPKVCGVEYLRKIFWSVPYGSANNNRIMVYDIEKNNWNPYAFDFGVKFLFRYTDNSGVLHLMAVQNDSAGTSILEINQQFTTDNGVPFECNIQSGLIHVSPDHVQWAHITYNFFEFDAPNGKMNMIFSGTPRNNPLEQIISESLNYGANQTPLGYSSFFWSNDFFSSQPPSGNSVVTNEISVKHRQFINKLVNNWEMNLITTGQFTLNTFTVNGQFIPVPPPSNWVSVS